MQVFQKNINSFSLNWAKSLYLTLKSKENLEDILMTLLLSLTWSRRRALNSVQRLINCTSGFILANQSSISLPNGHRDEISISVIKYLKK